MTFVAASAPAAAPAVFDGATGRWHDYDDLRAAVARLAARLRGRHKCLVFLLAGNDWASVVALLATLEAGHAAALLDPALPDARLAELIERYRPEMLIGRDPRPGAERLAEMGLDAWLESAPAPARRPGGPRGRRRGGRTGRASPSPGRTAP